MPYTPPSQRSPASTKPNSPTISRNHSYAEQSTSSPVAVARPALPRSISSTSYLNKHRRTPSISQKNNHAHNGEGDSREHHSLASANGSLRQSPPVSNLLIPSGAITTPPDSSDDEDRGRELGDLTELHQALRHIDHHRSGSPVRNDQSVPVPPTKVPVDVVAHPPPRALTPEARKISHSRSSSEITLSQHVTGLQTDATLISSSDDSDDDDDLRMKPPLLRKKSGELVKPALRPASRRRPSSMPGTPTFSKAVHFNEDIEQVRHFLQVDRPIAVSAGSSPVETYDSESEYPFGFEDRKSRPVEWDIRLANFPGESYERKVMPVRVERIFLSSDNKTLVGNVAVANISFQKFVVARFTLDYWKTTSEVVAEYNNDVRKKQVNDGYDRFNFNIKLADQANLEKKTLLLCVRYNVNGQEYWDNNGAMNFQVDFTKKNVARGKGAKQGPSAGPLGAIPRSRHSPPTTRPRSFPAASYDDDFSHGFENKYEFGSTRQLIGDSPNSTIRLKPKSKSRGNFFPDPVARKPTGASHAFSTRYDFGASLTAALSTAQSALGNKSGLKPAVPSKPTGFFDNSAKDTTRPMSASHAPVPGTRPGTFSNEKPDLQSAEYHELIQKFCFFGTPSGKGSPPVASPAAKNTHTDGAQDYVMDYSSGSNQNSGSSSPDSPEPSKDMSHLADGANDSKYPSRNSIPFLPRSSSPGSLTGSDPGDRTTSPLYYGGSPYNHNAMGGIFPEPCITPQACV